MVLTNSTTQILLSENRDSDVPGTDGPSVRLEISDDQPNGKRNSAAELKTFDEAQVRAKQSASICGGVA